MMSHNLAFNRSSEVKPVAPSSSRRNQDRKHLLFTCPQQFHHQLNSNPRDSISSSRNLIEHFYNIPLQLPQCHPATTAMTSLSRPTTMRSPSNKSSPPACPCTRKAFVLQSGATLSDQTALPTMATSTSLSAATPPTSRLARHKSASLMEGVDVHNTLDTTKPLIYTADVKQFTENAKCIKYAHKTQSSQLDSMLFSKLPRELRDKIYRYAVVEDNDITIHVTRFKTKDGKRHRHLPIGHALLRVCKQTRQEVGDIYYLENKIRITGDLLEKRAIRELSRLLTPWGERMTKLGVTHELVRGRDSLMKTKFSISAHKGRVFLEPEGFSDHEVNSLIDSHFDPKEFAAVSCSKMCFCKTSKLTLESRDVLSWMEGYVDLVLQSLTEPKSLPHCWACAGRIFI